MVERSAPVAARLREQVERLGAGAEAEVVHGEALAYLSDRPPRAFDVVFLDPPFARAELIGQCAALIEAHGWLKPGGFVYIEAPAHRVAFGLPPTWEIIRRGRAGEVGYWLARKAVNGV
jgi:16S rRNA (guanine966-N2)-methyltransferase